MSRQSPGRAVVLRRAKELREHGTCTLERARITQPTTMQKTEKVVDHTFPINEKGGELIALNFSGRSAGSRARARAKASVSGLALSLPENAYDRSLPHPTALELARLRTHYSRRIPRTLRPRLTSNCALRYINATLVLVCAPLGAALMTYSRKHEVVGPHDGAYRLVCHCHRWQRGQPNGGAGWSGQYLNVLSA